VKTANYYCKECGDLLSSIMDTDNFCHLCGIHLAMAPEAANHLLALREIELEQIYQDALNGGATKVPNPKPNKRPWLTVQGNKNQWERRPDQGWYQAPGHRKTHYWNGISTLCGRTWHGWKWLPATNNQCQTCGISAINVKALEDQRRRQARIKAV
tara:strand:+ start:67 stop:534 length:468 start_codon:yes stop_codon:yes gene_type:complete